MACLHELRRYRQFYIFINSDECNIIIMITQCSEINFRISRCGCLLLYINPKGYEVAEHKATKVELNPRMILTLKNEKSIWSMNTGAKFWDISGFTCGNFSYLGQEKNRAGLFQVSDICCETLHESFYCQFFGLSIETLSKFWLISWERFIFDGSHKVGITI